MHSLRCLLLFCALLWLTGCGGTPGILYSDVKMALTTPKDVELSLEQVKDSPYDILYLRINDQARISMVLAFLEHGQHKWVSADSALLIVEQGRVVRTQDFPAELLYTTNTAQDPLRLGPDQLVSAAPWLRLTDWRSGSGYAVQSYFTEQEPELLEVLQRQRQVRVFTEHVTFEQPNTAFTNTFWFDAASGLLLKSRQQLFPGGTILELTHLSPLVRYITTEEAL